MTTIQEVKQLRIYLKERGFNNRKVSVKHRYCGYSSSIDVTIKDLSIPIEDIEELASIYSSVSYCEASQEVLQGANTFVFVEYDREIMREATKLKLAEAEKILETLKNKQEGIGEILFETTELQIYLTKTASYNNSVATVHFENRDRSFNEKRSISCFNAYDLAEFLVIYEHQLKDRKEHIA